MSWQEDLQQLDRALAAGQISADDYRLRRDEVLANAAQALPGTGQQTPQQAPPQATTPAPGPFPPPFRWGEQSEATQVVPQGQGDGERTQVVRSSAPPAKSPDAERTQFIRPAQPAGGDADRTQVVPTGTPSGGFPAQIFPQQPPAPPVWQQDGNASAPPWGSGDNDGGSVWGNVQGPEVFEESGGKGKGKVIALVVVALLVVGSAVGAYFLWGRGDGTNIAGGSTTETTSSTSTPPPSPPPVRKTPDGPFVEVEGKASQFKTLDMADALVAKVPTFDEAQLLQQSGVTSVRFAVSQDDTTKLSQGIWAFKSTNPAATFGAVEQLYEAAQFQLLPTSPKGVPSRHLPITAANPISTYRAHYISTDFVVRVEAYGPDEAAAKLAFDTLLQRQLAKFPATA